VSIKFSDAFLQYIEERVDAMIVGLLLLSCGKARINGHTVMLCYVMKNMNIISFKNMWMHQLIVSTIIVRTISLY
jgi:hypothetical protein